MPSENEKHWQSACAVLRQHGSDPEQVLAKAASVLGGMQPQPATADMSETAPNLNTSPEHVKSPDVSAWLTEEQLREAESRAKHTPLSADPYTRGLARHIEALAAEVRRLREGCNEWERTATQMLDLVNERDDARSEVEQWKQEAGHLAIEVGVYDPQVDVLDPERLNEVMDEVRRLRTQHDARCRDWEWTVAERTDERDAARDALAEAVDAVRVAAKWPPADSEAGKLLRAFLAKHGGGRSDRTINETLSAKEKTP